MVVYQKWTRCKRSETANKTNKPKQPQVGWNTKMLFKSVPQKSYKISLNHFTIKQTHTHTYTYIGIWGRQEVEPSLRSNGNEKNCLELIYNFLVKELFILMLEKRRNKSDLPLHWNRKHKHWSINATRSAVSWICRTYFGLLHRHIQIFISSWLIMQSWVCPIYRNEHCSKCLLFVKYLTIIIVVQKSISAIIIWCWFS